MDLDATLKGLHNFKARMEKLLDGGLLERLEAAAGAVSGSGNEELSKHVDELADTVTGIQQTLEKLPETIAASLDQALQASPQMAAVGKLADPAVIDLLDWLAGNREAIDVLLSIGETADGTPEPAPAEAASIDKASTTATADQSAQAGS